MHPFETGSTGEAAEVHPEDDPDKDTSDATDINKTQSPARTTQAELTAMGDGEPIENLVGQVDEDDVPEPERFKEVADLGALTVSSLNLTLRALAARSQATIDANATFSPHDDPRAKETPWIKNKSESEAQNDD